MVEENNNFYFTFMGKQAFANYYVRITAADMEAARICMQCHFGDKWAFAYKEKEFLNQIIDYNLQPLVSLCVLNRGAEPAFPIYEYFLDEVGKDKINEGL